MSKYEINKSQVFVWENEDLLPSQQEVLQKSASWKAEYQAISHPAKQREFLNSRCLLHQVFRSTEFPKNEHGAFLPLANNLHISLSHTSTYVTLAISPSPVGIDCEAYRPALEHIWNRCTHENERKYFHSAFEKTLLWTTKEAIYKQQQYGLEFAKDIILERYTGSEKGMVEGTVKHTPFRCSFITLHEHIITVTC